MCLSMRVVGLALFPLRPGFVGRGQLFLPENSHAPKMSHVISLGQFLMCRENVGIATVRFQSLNNVEGNYVRHLWGTMRVCGEPCACGQERAGPASAGGNRSFPKTRT